MVGTFVRIFSKVWKNLKKRYHISSKVWKPLHDGLLLFPTLGKTNRLTFWRVAFW